MKDIIQCTCYAFIANVFAVSLYKGDTALFGEYITSFIVIFIITSILLGFEKWK